MTTTTLAQPPRRPTAPRRWARVALAVVAAALVAAASFLLVIHFQPTAPPAGPTSGGPSPVPILPPVAKLVGGIGAGDGAWFDNYDGGNLTSRFRARQYTPHPDGSVSVDHPVADFYIGHGEILRLTGQTGEVFLGQPTGDGLPTSLHAPTTGTLHHVHIARYPDGDPDHGRPTLTMDTDNVRFDNDSARLFTERMTDADGHDVPGDRVPVLVRGDDYEMDGTGLTLRWNGPARRLHLLEIAHGHRLTLLHPNATRTNNGVTPTLTAAAPPPQRPVELVSTDPTAAKLAPPPPASTHPAAPPAPPYRAVFNDAVVVKQAGQTLATGDVLTLDFLQGKSTDRPPPPATRPTPPPTAAPTTAPTPSATLATTAPIAKVPTTKPDPRSEPVTIYWTGKLRVTPLESPPMMPLTAGHAVVRLAGRPATLTSDDATVTAAVATYRTGDDALRLDPSPACPAVDVRQKGTTLTSAGVAFDPATSVATIDGPATLIERDRSGRPTTVTWADRGLLHVATDPLDEHKLVGVDHVDLAGAVHAVDPAAFDLAAHRLLLDFDLLPPTTRPAKAADPERRSEGRPLRRAAPTPHRRRRRHLPHAAPGRARPRHQRRPPGREPLARRRRPRRPAGDRRRRQRPRRRRRPSRSRAPPGSRADRQAEAHHGPRHDASGIHAAQRRTGLAAGHRRRPGRPQERLPRPGRHAPRGDRPRRPTTGRAVRPHRRHRHRRQGRPPGRLGPCTWPSAPPAT